MVKGEVGGGGWCGVGIEGGAKESLSEGDFNEPSPDGGKVGEASYEILKGCKHYYRVGIPRSLLH